MGRNRSRGGAASAHLFPGRAVKAGVRQTRGRGRAVGRGVRGGDGAVRVGRRSPLLQLTGECFFFF